MEHINKSMIRRSEINSVHISSIEYEFKVIISTNTGVIPAEYNSRDLAIEQFNSVQMQINNEKEFITIEKYISE
ncbi:MAG: hypothetical protein ACK58Q_09975 [Chitinophagales bacterium]|jgi:hypothetical protein